MEISNICQKCYLKFLSIKNENEMISLQSQKHKLLIWKNEVICSYEITYNMFYKDFTSACLNICRYSGIQLIICFWPVPFKILSSNISSNNIFFSALQKFYQSGTGKLLMSCLLFLFLRQTIILIYDLFENLWFARWSNQFSSDSLLKC